MSNIWANSWGMTAFGKTAFSVIWIYTSSLSRGPSVLRGYWEFSQKMRRFRQLPQTELFLGQLWPLWAREGSEARKLLVLCSFTCEYEDVLRICGVHRGDGGRGSSFTSAPWAKQRFYQSLSFTVMLLLTRGPALVTVWFWPWPGENSSAGKKLTNLILVFCNVNSRPWESCLPFQFCSVLPGQWLAHKCMITSFPQRTGATKGNSVYTYHEEWALSINAQLCGREHFLIWLYISSMNPLKTVEYVYMSTIFLQQCLLNIFPLTWGFLCMPSKQKTKQKLKQLAASWRNEVESAKYCARGDLATDKTEIRPEGLDREWPWTYLGHEGHCGKGF